VSDEGNTGSGQLISLAATGNVRADQDGESTAAGDAEAVCRRHHRRQARAAEASPEPRRALHGTRHLHRCWSYGKKPGNPYSRERICMVDLLVLTS